MDGGPYYLGGLGQIRSHLGSIALRPVEDPSKSLNCSHHIPPPAHVVHEAGGRCAVVRGGGTQE
eukprot:467259-Heterocapsa_arctica.AAC.1